MAIKSAASSINYALVREERKSVAFVKQGAKVASGSKSSARTGLLHKAGDWQMNVDFDGSGTVPPFVARTTRRPDIVMYSKLTKRVVIIELTNGCEENFQGWHEKKRRSYSKDLIPDMEKNGWKVDFFPVEVGARGY